MAGREYKPATALAGAGYWSLELMYLLKADEVLTFAGAEKELLGRQGFRKFRQVTD